MNRHKPECQAACLRVSTCACTHACLCGYARRQADRYTHRQALRRLRTIHKQRFLAHAEKLRQEREVSRKKIDLVDQTD